MRELGRVESFEGMVIEEVAALAREASSRSNVFFWRTEAGGEVDLIVTVGRHVIPIEDAGRTARTS